MRTDKPHCRICGRINYEDVVVEYVPRVPYSMGTVPILDVFAKRTCRKCGNPIYYE